MTGTRITTKSNKTPKRSINRLNEFEAALKECCELENEEESTRCINQIITEIYEEIRGIEPVNDTINRLTSLY